MGERFREGPDVEVEEYVREVSENLRESPARGDGTMPVRVERLREVLDMKGEQYPKALVDVDWWRRVLSDVERQLEPEDEPGGGGR